MATVKVDRPMRVGPRTHEHAPCATMAKLFDQRRANAEPLAIRPHIGVTNEIDVSHGLNAHYADELTADISAPERDTGRDVPAKVGVRHVGLVPAIGRD